MGEVYIGTSGWSYKSWQREFYPPKLPVSKHLDYYATQFHTVEINLTFYRLPAPQMVQGWNTRAPRGFVYAVKGSRFITHMKKLMNLDGALDRFYERLEPMRNRIAVVLWQLPPMLKNDPARLSEFLTALPAGCRHAVEFRHPSWLNDETFTILRRHGVAHVSVSSLGMPMDLTTTTDFVYARFHGLAGGYAHDYTAEELAPWIRHISNEASQGRTVFAYFNNDANVRAPWNARMLLEMVRSELE